MIDLHIHTNYSDGTDDLEKLLRNASSANLEVISITDHDTCKTYFEMEKNNTHKLFNGNIIVGCEFTTHYNKRLIEVLGYGIDYKVVQEYLNNFYNNDLIVDSFRIIYMRLKEKLNEYDFICNFDDEHLSFYHIYKDLIKHPENLEKIDEDVFKSYVDFYRKGLYNPDSKLFLNHVEFKPCLKDILNIINDSGGIAFLAHPYVYKISNTESFLNNIYDENNFDGIECYYTTNSKEETKCLLDFANSRNLLISGGSDYHGEKRKGHELGVGNGNLKILKKTISNWNVSYFK